MAKKEGGGEDSSQPDRLTVSVAGYKRQQLLVGEKISVMKVRRKKRKPKRRNSVCAWKSVSAQLKWY